MENISIVPIGLFVGSEDELADATDNEWLKDQLKTLIHYKEYTLGHLSFLVANDMSYFMNDAVGIIQ